MGERFQGVHRKEEASRVLTVVASLLLSFLCIRSGKYTRYVSRIVKMQDGHARVYEVVNACHNDELGLAQTDPESIRFIAGKAERPGLRRFDPNKVRFRFSPLVDFFDEADAHFSSFRRPLHCPSVLSKAVLNRPDQGMLKVSRY